MTREEMFSTVMSSTAVNEQFIKESILWNLGRHAGLEKANERRHIEVTDGIRRAADYYLPVLEARGVKRCHYARDLRKYLKANYRGYGLEAVPHIKTIRKNIKAWRYGGSLSV